MQNHKNLKVEEQNCIWSKIERVLKKNKIKNMNKLYYQQYIGFNIIDNNM